ncbi:MAG: FAD-binding oxidoreductase [Candidatus Aminicenantes bacterium]|nr:FAD-binding oxidoreductase [Candidatus Aminicenantes bacterium]MDH5384355.1 FAD-binding oxidoreductase [Candidatus Aminicenantes bacterium]
MARLNNKDKKWLEEKFGKRANFNPTERLLYSHDIAAIPGLFKPLIGKTVPDAVVQPENEEELVELVRWAAQKRIPIVPRGKGSSGYGGIIPTRKGIVVDFYRMKDVLSMDAGKEIVTVQPGITWEQLDKKIKPNGLTIRLYPTSYPSSSVGGWLAQGGAGIGSFEYGWFSENVESVRIVLPSGEVKEVSEKDLEMVADAEGTTGLISQMTIRVQKLTDIGVTAIACPDARKLAKVFQEFIEQNLPIWSLVFINPRMAEMKNRAPVLTHHGHPVEPKVILPAAYIATIAFREEDRERVVSRLPLIVKACEGEVLKQEIADHEWEERFKLMVVKRLGPSLVPAEVVVPLEKLGDVMEEIEDKVNQPVVKEGVIIKQGKNGKPEAVILGFIPSDQRKFSYNFVFGLVLSIMKIAEKHGGHPYSTGLYFTHKIEEINGKNRSKRLKAFKKQVDRHKILNPDKVMGGKLVGRALSLASVFEPIIRPLGNTVVTQVGERFAKSIRGVPPDVAWYAYACSQCGYCLDECDQFFGRGWESQSPRGKWYWLRQYLEGKEKWDQFMVDTILVCTTCEFCNLRCSAALPIEPSWMKLRGKLIHEDKKMTFPPFEMMAAALRAEGNIWAGYRKNRTAWFPEELWSKHGPDVKSKNVYFAGCTASYVEHDIGAAAVTLLDSAGVDFTYLGNVENCCGTPMLVAGKWDVFAEVIKKNIEAVKATGADTVITSCPACDMMWRYTYKEWADKIGIDCDIKTKHYSEVIAEKLRSGEFKFTHPIEKKVTWHDSCHIGRVSGVYDEPREVIKAIPGVEFEEMAHNRQEGHCCGSVLTLIKEPLVAHDIGKSRLDEANEINADSVLALCPCCEFQLRVSKDKKNLSVDIQDLATFACKGLGKEFKDPSPEVAKQWAVFEGMIALMTPQGFADLMDTMWPELLDAMPMGMGGMMRFVGKMGFVGDALFAMMKPIFPVLFPRLFPKMMPKVMPTMLERVGQMIPMPDYMAEQMPAMMPKIMDNLMPHMLPEVVPLAVPMMIAHLR